MALFRLVAATRAWQRMAKTRRQVEVKPTIRYENSYKMTPDSIHRFRPNKVEDMIYDILETKLKRKTYSPEYCKSATTDLTSIIKAKVKMMDFQRYKIVCNVILMERRNQGVDVSSQCVWNCDTDSYATVTYSNPTITAVVFVHGVYFE